MRESVLNNSIPLTQQNYSLNGVIFRVGYSRADYFRFRIDVPLGYEDRNGGKFALLNNLIFMIYMKHLVVLISFKI